MTNTISKIFENWKTARATRAAAKRKLIASFSRFVEETRPITPKAGKHPIAALYRHVWKRAVVLENIATTSGDHDSVSLYKQFQEIAARQYYSAAPETRYGKARLSLSSSAGGQLKQTELAHKAARERNKDATSGRLRAVVYLLKAGSNYKIGRTTDFKRRLNEIKLQLPDPVTVEHTIQTNHPVEIESYWHERFSNKRKNGEWFGLDDKDVSEFTSHSQMR